MLQKDEQDQLDRIVAALAPNPQECVVAGMAFLALARTQLPQHPGLYTANAMYRETGLPMFADAVISATVDIRERTG